jgi:hypothetical protein
MCPLRMQWSSTMMGHISTLSGSLVKCPPRYQTRIRYTARHRAVASLPLSGRRLFTSSAKKRGGPANEEPSFFSSFLSWYSNKLDTHPLLTKGVSSGIIAGSGDFLCQLLFIDRRNVVKDEHGESKGKSASTSSLLANWDAARTGRFALLGAFLVAPVIHYWYNALSMRLLPGAATVSNVMKRVALDQFIFSPLFLQAWLSALWTLEGETPLDTIPSRMIEATPEIMVANWVRILFIGEIISVITTLSRRLLLVFFSPKDFVDTCTNYKFPLCFRQVSSSV